jgi:hypothetical protein
VHARTTVHIKQRLRDAADFARLPRLGPMYIRYEDRIVGHGCNNLATPCVFSARKGGGFR